MKRVMCKTYVVSAVLLLILSVPLEAQLLPAMTYGGSHDERCNGIVADPNGNGYILVGWTKSYGPGTPNFSNVLAVKTDSAGLSEGAKISLGTEDDQAQSIITTLDGGFAIAGWTESYGADSVGTNAFVVKIDANGAFQWGWVYSDIPGLGRNMPAYSIAQTRDSGYVLTGWSDFSGGNHSIYLLKIDANGNFVYLMNYWFPPNSVDEGYSIYALPAPMPYEILIAGRANISSLSNYDAFVIALDSLGLPVFPASIIPGASEDEAYSVTWDGMNAVVAGWTNSYGPGLPNANAIIWKTDFIAPDAGFAYGLDNEEKIMGDRALIKTMSGDYAACGWTTSAGPGIPNPNMLIFKVDTTLAGMQWVRVHPSAGGLLNDQAYSIVETSRGYAIAGFTNSFGLGGEDFHLVTLDPSGDRPVCVIDTSLQLAPFDVDFSAFQYASFPLIFQVPITVQDTIVDYYPICSIPPGIREQSRKATSNDLSLTASFERITVQLNLSGWLNLNLYDVSGRHVFDLAHGQFAKGTHSFNLPKNLSAGVYFVSADFESMKKSTKVIRYQ